MQRNRNYGGNLMQRQPQKGSRTRGLRVGSAKRVKNVFQNSNNVYNNFIIENSGHDEENYPYVNLNQPREQPERRQVRGGVSLVGQSRTKKQVYHLGKTNEEFGVYVIYNLRKPHILVLRK